jgi:demethylmenaquinone methyltransferase/2-methoxy-6-polyprenyl-1,4-benzoquinol methylase
MLDEANLKRGALPDAQQIFMAFCQGDGMALPLSDESFDAVTISFGLRNMADRHQSLIEMRRVLRPGGRMFVLEFSQPARWVKPFYYFYLRWIMPLLASLITGDRAAYTYLNESIEKFPDAEALSDEIRAAGFSNVSWTKLSWGTVALHAAVR